MDSVPSARVEVQSRDGFGRVLTVGKLLTLAGLSLYVASFLLSAVEERRIPSYEAEGYTCAEYALLVPWSGDGRQLIHERPLEFFSLVFAGWVNVFFVAATVSGFLKAGSRTTIVLKILTLACIPFSWIVLAYERLYPREGHIAWIVGMLVTFAGLWLSKPVAAANVLPSGS